MAAFFQIIRVVIKALFLNIAVLAITLVWPFCSYGQREHSPVVTRLEAKQAYEFVRGNSARDLVILDIRTPGEFATGHLEGAINIDYRSGAFAREIDKLDRSKTYFIYCRIGRRSAGAIDIMTRRGFKKFIQVPGDIEAWKAAGLPLVKMKQ